MPDLCSVNSKEHILRTRDGYSIGLTHFLPADKREEQVLVVAPGAGMPQFFYRLFAEFCAREGFPTITFDYRGIGRSGNGTLRRFNTTLKQWAIQDLNAVLLFARNQYPTGSVTLIGHCIGGEIAGIAPASEYLNRIVLVNSALSSWRLWPLKDQPRILLLKLFAPLINAWFGYFPGRRLRFLQDMPQGVLRELSDWCNRYNGLFDVHPDNNYRKLQIPLLCFSFSDDWYAPPRAVSALLGHFSNTNTQWLHLNPKELGLPGVGHDGFFLPDCQPLWQLMLNWLKVPTTAKGYFF